MILAGRSRHNHLRRRTVAGMDENTRTRPTVSRRSVLLGIAAALLAAVLVGGLIAILTATLAIGIGGAALVGLICAIWMWRTHRAGGDEGTLDPRDSRIEDRDALNTANQARVRGSGVPF